MRIVRNSGTERILDFLKPILGESASLDVVTPSLSLFAFAELMTELAKLKRVRLVLPPFDQSMGLLGTEADRPFRNRLQIIP